MAAGLRQRKRGPGCGVFWTRQRHRRPVSLEARCLVVEQRVEQQSTWFRLANNWIAGVGGETSQESQSRGREGRVTDKG